MKILLVILLLFVSGCTQQFVISTQDAMQEIKDYKNGVLYFPYCENDFGKMLSAYRERNPDIKIISIVGDGNGIQGRDKGYFVILEKDKDGD